MIELNQGDTDRVPFVLKEDGVGIDLTRCSVTFVMKLISGTTKYTIDVTPGATVDGVPVLYSAGGVTVLFSSVETATAGDYYGYFSVDEFGEIRTFPTVSSNYVRVVINKAF